MRAWMLVPLLLPFLAGAGLLFVRRLRLRWRDDAVIGWDPFA